MPISCWPRPQPGVVAAFLLLLAVRSLGAQLPTPRLQAVAPCGGRAGKNVEVQLAAGAHLASCDRLVFSHPGLTAQLLDSGPSETNLSDPRFLVWIADDVPSGSYEVRCVGPLGASNPRRFVVGRRPEALSLPENDSPERALPVEIGTVVNGAPAAPGNAVWIRFSAIAGQRIVLDCQAARIDSSLQGALSVWDANGRRLLSSGAPRLDDPCLLFDVPADGEYFVRAHDLTFRSGPEFFFRLSISVAPYIAFTIPSAAPAGARASISLYGFNLPGGQLTDRTLRGAPLERLEVEIPVPSEGDRLDAEGLARPQAAFTDAFAYRLSSDGAESNVVSIGIAACPVELESEPNDVPAEAQLLTAPVEAHGRFDRPGDRDLFRFDAKAKETLSVDLLSDRIRGGSVDPVLVIEEVVTGKDGNEELKSLQTLDDAAGGGLPARLTGGTTDPSGEIKIPRGGRYQATVFDRHGGDSGGEQGYRLILRRPAPDFRVASLPAGGEETALSAATLRRGDRLPMTLFVERRDGFSGEVRVFAADLPDGVRCAPVIVAAGESTGMLTFESDVQAPSATQPVTLIAEAVVDAASAPVSRRVRPLTVSAAGSASVLPRLRVTDDLQLSVADETAPMQLLTESAAFDVRPGRQLLLPIRLRREGYDGPVTLTAMNAPNKDKFELQVSDIPANEDSTLLRLFVKENADVGLVSFWLQAQATVPYLPLPAPGASAAEPQMLEIAVPSPLFQLRVAAAPLSLKAAAAQSSAPAGGSVDIVVKIARKKEFTGPVTLSLSGPEDLEQSLHAAEVVVPADQKEATLQAAVPPDAAAGTIERLVVRARAEFHGEAIVDAPLSLSITASAP